MATHDPAAVPPQARRRRWLKKSILFAVLPYFSVIGLLTSFQRSLIYVPTRVAELPVSHTKLSAGSAEPITVTTEDGLTLHGWWLTARKARPKEGRAPSNEQDLTTPLVLYFCGNAGHRGFRMQEYEILTALGADVLCCDYRGFGDNSGKPSEAGLAADARAVWDFATRTREIPPERIVIFGESLGGGVAVRLAEEVCDADTPPAGLILRSTFSSLTDVAAGAYPWLPVRWLLLERYPSDERIGQITCPLLMLHGRRDTIVPYRLGRKLFDAAPEQSSNQIAKRMVDLPRADHNDVLETEGPAFRKAVRDFLKVVTARE